MKKLITSCLIYTYCFLNFGNLISQTEFVTTWKTDNPGTSNATSITIPTTGTGYSYDVDWENDGTFDDFGVTIDITHDYGTAGTYTVAIKGDFPRIYFNNSGDSQKIVSIDQWGTQQWTSMNSSFYGCINLLGNVSDDPDLSIVNDLSSMFSGATLFNQDLSTWDVSNITSMRSMFFGAENFDQNIGTWDVSNVIDMSEMFRSASSFNQDIGGWNLSGVTDLSSMFRQANSFNQDIGSWVVSSVEDMESMFEGAASFNQDIGAWDVSAVTNMNVMFYQALNFNQDLNLWDVSSVISMEGMFGETSIFNQPLNNWNVSSVTNMLGLFYEATTFNQDIGSWNISNVTDMSDMFTGVTLSPANYDNILIGWSTLDAGEAQIPTGVTFSGGNSEYCNGETARSDLNFTYGWTITDGGLDCTTLSVDSFENDITFLVYPNPNSGTLRIRTDFECEFKIINQLGQTVQSFKVKSNIENSIVLNDLADGVYFVRGQLQGKEIIKQIVVKK